MSRYGLVVDELDAVLSINERTDLNISRFTKVRDSKKSDAVSMDEVWATVDNRQGKILEWFKLF